MVIEFRARTRQAQGFARALFLPGLVKRRTAPAMQREHLMQGVDAEEVSSARQEPPQELDIVITQSSR
jgi:hypothetical protein